MRSASAIVTFFFGGSMPSGGVAMQHLKVGFRLSAGFVVMLIVCLAVAENVPLQRLVHTSRQATASARTLQAKTTRARPLDQVGSSGGNRIATTIAGLTRSPYGLGGPATSAYLESSTGVAFDQAGNMYIAVDCQVLEVNATTGIISVFAGTDQPGYTADGQFAVNTQFLYINGIAFDRAGNLYIADGSNGVIRQVNVATGIVTTVAGNKSNGYAGDGGPATKAELDYPSGIAVDASGNLYIADSGNNAIRRVAASTGVITTVAGVRGQGGYSGDGGPATSAQLEYPEAVVVDSNGNLYIGDEDNDVVRKVTAGGTISTYAGNGNYGNAGDNGAATAAQLDGLQYLAVDTAGNLYISTSTNVRKVTASTGVITTVAGTGEKAATGDGGAAINAGTTPEGVAIDASGNLYIAGNNRVRRVDNQGIISTVAGTGLFSPLNNGAAATSAPLGVAEPAAIVLDAAGNVYFADAGDNAIRKISAVDGTISTIAGNGQAGYSGDGGPATAAELNYPMGLALDRQGNLYIAEYFNFAVRKVNLASGIISTFAGNGSTAVSGDGGPATAASVFYPTAVAVDGSGNLYIGEEECAVRMVNPAGIITTVAGKFDNCYYGSANNGDGGPATSAELSNSLFAIAVDAGGNVYIGGAGNVRKVSASTGIITTVAGTGQQGTDTGDGGAATAATLGTVYGLGFDGAGDMYIADGTIRTVNPSGIISTAIGQAGFGYSGDGGPVASAEAYASGVAVDAASNIYFADAVGNRIRKIWTSSPQPAASEPEITPAGGTYGATQTVTIADTTPGAQIFFTLDGSSPNPGTSELYTGPLSLVGTVQLSAIAIAPGYSTSGVANGAYTFPTPQVSGSGSSDVTLGPATVTFPSTTVAMQSDPVTVTLSNYNNINLAVSAISVTGDFSETNTCGTSVSGGTACYIYITFSPTTAGTRTGTLTVTDNAGNSPQTVALTGTSVSAGVAIATNTTLTSSGSIGSYTLNASVAGIPSASSPTGTVNFIDTSNNNQSLGTATLGKASPTFSLANGPGYSTGPQPEDAAIGDFNGDGKQDIAVLNSNFPCATGSASISVFLGNGDGTFSTSAPLTLNTCSVTENIVVADFNRDGRSDIAYGSSAGITILYGNADGTFTPQSVYSGGSISTLAAGDVNGDGTPDLVFQSGGATTILLGQPGATFTPASASSVPAADWIKIADINGDQKQDLLLWDGSNITVCLGNGDGTFGAPTVTQIPNEILGGSAEPYATGDFNADGKLDVVIEGGISIGSGNAVDGIVVLTGNGDGTFSVGSPIAISTTAASDSGSVVVHDFNGDGKDDVAVLNDYTVQVLISNGDGTFTPGASLDSGAETDPDNLTLTVGDFNGDGVPDLASVNSDADLVAVSLGVRTQVASASLTNVGVSGAGTHNVEAVYSGDSNFAPSTSNTVALTAAAVPVATSLSLQSSASSSSYGQQLTFTATLSPYSAQSITTDGEKVTFSSGGNSIGTATLSSGVATLSTASLPVGSQTITASYAGDANFAPASSSALTVVVNPLAVGLSSSTTQLTISSPGGSATASIQISPGSSGTVNLACTVQYEGTPVPSDLPTCTLNPAQVQVSAGTPASTTLTVKTTPSGGSARLKRSLIPTGASLAALLLCGFVPRRRWRTVVALILCAVATTIIGCGGGSKPMAPSNPGTPTGSYKVNITATNGTLTGSTTIPLTVQ
jgi:Bacterial Ig-like domain (group 3)/Chitobiase/beta-hexosaminidase C-terminal domain/FG-GAP-like repeat/NHL repeat